MREEDGLAAGDPEWVIQQLMTKYRIDIGVLTGTMTGRASSTTRASAAPWPAPTTIGLLDKWVRPYACFKGSINVAPQDPEAAAREIHRLGDDPGHGPGADGERGAHPVWPEVLLADLPRRRRARPAGRHPRRLRGHRHRQRADRGRLPVDLPGVPHRPLADDDGALRQRRHRGVVRGVPDAPASPSSRAASAGRPT